MEAFIYFIVSVLIAIATRPRPPSQPPAAVDDFEIPTADEDRSIPVVFGTVNITGPNVVWSGDFDNHVKTKDGTKYYNYHLGIHFALCYGPVNSFLRVKVGDKIAWEGDVTASDSIFIDKGELFGGRYKEGGIKGYLDLMMGEPTQGANAYLTAVQGPVQPGYRGVTSCVFHEGTTVGSYEGGLVSANSTYIKPWEFRLKRTTEGWVSAEAAVVPTWEEYEPPGSGSWTSGRDTWVGGIIPRTDYGSQFGGAAYLPDGSLIVTGYTYWYDSTGYSQLSRVAFIRSSAGVWTGPVDIWGYQAGTQAVGFDPFNVPEGETYALEPLVLGSTIYVCHNTNYDEPAVNEVDYSLVSKSTDGGQTWSTIVDTSKVSASRCAVSANGIYKIGCLAANMTYNGIDGPLYICRTTDEGDTWAATEITGSLPLDQWYYPPRNLSLAIDADGNCHALYVDYDGTSDLRVRYLRPTSASAWASPVTLASSAYPYTLTTQDRFILRALQNAPGTLVALWGDDASESLWIRRSTNNGVSWSAAVEIPIWDGVEFGTYNMSSWGGDYDLVELGNGNLLIFLTTVENLTDADYYPYYMVSEDAGATFGPMTRIAGLDDSYLDFTPNSPLERFDGGAILLSNSDTAVGIVGCSAYSPWNLTGSYLTFDTASTGAASFEGAWYPEKAEVHTGTTGEWLDTSVTVSYSPVESTTCHRTQVADVGGGHWAVALAATKTLSPPMEGLWDVDMPLGAWDNIYGYSPATSYTHPFGAVTNRAATKMFAMWGNAGYADTVYAELVQYDLPSGTPSTLHTGSFMSFGWSFYVNSLRKVDPDAAIVSSGRSNGGGGGCFWAWCETTSGTVSSRSLNTDGGMPSHSGQGHSVCEFGGKAFFSGNNTSHSYGIPLWRCASLSGAVEAWEGSDTTLQTVLTGKLGSAVEAVSVVATSDTSPTKRLYVFVAYCPKLAYKTSAAGAWGTISLPSGEYVAGGDMMLQPSHDGYVYFCTTTGTSAPGDTVRLRAVDESGAVLLIGTMPSSAVLFPDTVTVLNKFPSSVAPAHDPDLDYAVTAVAVTMLGKEGGFGGPGTGLHDTALVVFYRPRELTGDMNPAHILYECLTNRTWGGMRLPTAAIDDASFREAADIFYAEGMGLSLQWVKEGPIEDFMQTVVDHCLAVYGRNPSTGLYFMKPIRGGYDVGTLPVFDESLVMSVESFERASYGEMVNQITIVYRDRETNEDVPITVQNLAAIQAQGCLVSETLQRPGFSRADIAQRAALSELQARSIPLAKGTFTCRREGMPDLYPGAVIILSWEKLGIVELVVRVAEVDYGSPEDGRLRVTFLEDVFGLPEAAYITEQPSLADPEDSAALDVAAKSVFEAPYWMLKAILGDTEYAAMPPDVGYLMALAKKPNGYHYDFAMHSKIGVASYAENYESATFSDCALLTYAIAAGQNVISINTSTLDVTLTLPAFAFIGDSPTLAETVVITAGDMASNLTVQRGVLDTVPRWHPSGTRVWTLSPIPLVPGVLYDDGDVVDAKILTNTSEGALAEGDATASQVTFAARKERPLPPGNVLINGEEYPVTIAETSLTVTWAHRHRYSWPVSYQNDASVTPESGTTYNVYAYNDDTEALLDSDTGISGTSWAPSIAIACNLRIEVETQCSGYVSWQRQSRVFEYFPSLRVTDDDVSRETDAGDTRLTDD